MGVITIPVLVQYLQLRQLLEGMLLHPDRPDMPHSKWSESGKYSVTSAYKAMFLGQASMSGAKEL
jgi:hypothetical protein